jgi:hypothetical protein
MAATNWLQDNTFRMTLTNYAVGNYNEKKNKIAEVIAPTVRVPSVAGIFKTYNTKEAFQILDTTKVPGESAQTVAFSATDSNYNCRRQALDAVIPNELLETENREAAMILYQAHVDYLISLACTNHEYQVFNKVASSVAANGSYGASWSIASSSAATNNPLSEIEKAYYDIASAIGEFPNKMVVGPNAWRYIKFAYASKGTFPAYAVNDDQVRDYFRGLGNGLEVHLGILAYANNLGQSARTMTNIVSANDVYIFYASNTPNVMDRSAFKTFQFGAGIDNLGSYLTPDQRETKLKVDWFIDPQLVNQYAVTRITAT